MKNFKTLISDYEKLCKSKKEVVRDYDVLSPSDYKNLDRDAKNKYHEAIRAYNEEVKKVQAYNNDLELKKTVLKNNIRCALYEDIKQPLIEVLNKYKNKQLGPKTTAAIQADFKELTGCSIWFDTTSYSSLHSIKIYPLNKEGYSYRNIYDVSIEADFRDINNNVISRKFLDNNRLKDVTNDNFYCIHNAEAYIDNINKYIKEYKKAYNNAYNLMLKYQAAVEEYNNILVGDLHYMSKYDCKFNDKYL